MNFLVPGAFFLGLLLPVIISLYLLKLRRTEQTVSSTYLWRQMVRDVEANAPWQRLRWNLLLFVQLLFMILLILAVARPFAWREGVSGEAVIFVFDTSASMQAEDVAPSRIDAAKEQAVQMLNDLPESTRVTVITAGLEADVRVSSSHDRRQALLAIEGVQADDGGSEMQTALELASAMAGQSEDTEIVVFSDGGVSLNENMSVRGHLRYYPMGIGEDNQAIGLLSIEEQAGTGLLRLFARLDNYGKEDVICSVEIYADDQLVDVQEVELAGMGNRTIGFDALPASTRYVRLKLDGQDLLAVDDEAWVIRRGSEPIEVLLVSEGNLFLETALRLLPQLELSEVSPSDEIIFDEKFDLVVFDQFVPDGDFPDSNLLIIAPETNTQLFDVSGQVSRPALRIVDLNDPLVEYVNSLANINVAEAVGLTVEDWGVPVVTGDTLDDSYPMLLRGVYNGQRVVILAFDLYRSDFALNASFPILWSNIIDWLVGMQLQANDGILLNAVPGEVVAFPAADDSRPGSMQVIPPDGRMVKLSSNEDGQYIFDQTNQTGLYEVKNGTDLNGFFAVNLFSPQESTIKPRERLPVAGIAGSGADEEQMVQREWWRILAVVALSVLLIEWLLYQRASLVYLKGKAVVFLKQLLRKPN